MFCLFPFVSLAQRLHTVSGTIKDESNGEVLIGATIRVVNAPAYGAVSNEYGFYSLTLPPGTFTIEYTILGFATKTFELQADGNKKLDVLLREQSTDLGEVVVKANAYDKVTGTQMGFERLDIKEVANIPVLFGERDPLKVMQLLPGVKAAGDGNSGFYVRGGGADQNLILLDEAPVYNASHLLGFFSTFNADAIKDLTIYKGGMPAQYGGRLSSVVDIKMNEGNNKRYEVSGGVGLISARVKVEGPIRKEKSSFLLSARRTYADVFLRSNQKYKDYKLYFFDLNAKLNFQLGVNDRLYISGYTGKDEMGLGTTFGLDWGNATGTLRWNHVYGNKLFSNTSVIVSNYDYNIAIENGGNQFSIFSQIRDHNLKHEFQWYPDNKHAVRAGFNSIFHAIRPGEVTSTESSSVNDRKFQRRYSIENAAYLSDIWKMGDRVSLNYGVRLTAATVLGGGDFYTFGNDGAVPDTLHFEKGEVVKTYWNVEPRLTTSVKVNESSSVKASYVRNSQNLHLISNSTSSNPTDKWISNTNNIKPELSDQVSLGYYANLFGDRYEFSTEVYYKSMTNQIDYRDGADVFSNFDVVESQLLYGKGRAYGLEWQIKKNSGKLTGWLSYTLSKTERQIEGINGNQWYNARQDRTHDVAIVGTYRANDKWTFSANWVYYTGDAITFPVGKYRIDGRTVYLYSGRNGYRMPNYHRLDLGATVQLRKRKHWQQELSFSIYNAYGRENAYTIDFRDSETRPGGTDAVQTALFKYIPSISYNFKF